MATTKKKQKKKINNALFTKIHFSNRNLQKQPINLCVSEWFVINAQQWHPSKTTNKNNRFDVAIQQQTEYI